KTAAIDALIEKKQKLLELLAEKRTALINRAVTKGLDPDVPMKDSGVPWIGEIPAHWEVAPVYSFAAVQLGKMLDSSRQTGQDSAPYLRNANVQWDGIATDDLNRMDFSRSDRLKYQLKSGDILMCEGGVVGRSAIWRGQVDGVLYQKALHRVRTNRRALPEFFIQSIRAAFDQGVFLEEASATISHLTAERLRVLRFPRPPIPEQASIAAHLGLALETSVGASQRMADQIDRLREYRQALITAAVTGQIDVEAA
ncbi:MAG: hypothetical protein H6720_31000, partial [Sandaracinus sp.]|nr:hypothetical protein [Sandaracinus sp.]